jgi:hypothetical protein
MTITKSKLEHLNDEFVCGASLDYRDARDARGCCDCVVGIRSNSDRASLDLRVSTPYLINNLVLEVLKISKNHEMVVKEIALLLEVQLGDIVVLHLGAPRWRDWKIITKSMCLKKVALKLTFTINRIKASVAIATIAPHTMRYQVEKCMEVLGVQVVSIVMQELCLVSRVGVVSVNRTP